MSEKLLETARAYLNRYDLVKKLEQQIKDAKVDRDTEEELLVNEFAETGIESITITDEDGELARVLSPKRDLLPSVKTENKESAIPIFKAQGLDDLVIEQIQSGRLKSWVKEQEEDENGMPVLPEELKVLINVYEKWSISTRKATKKKTPRRAAKKKTTTEEVIELDL